MKAIWAAGIAILLGALFVPTQSALAVNTNNFRITSYTIQYELSRDSESRSVLKTTETITALFPNSNQNRGIERAIPQSYDGHSTSLKIDSVTNEAGQNQEYTDDTRGGNTVVRIGDPDKYVQGLQTYKLIYTQRDVTKVFADTGREEWYWDTNGTDWRVPIANLTVSVKIADELSSKRSGEPFCYQGAAGSTDRCTLTRGDDGIYTVNATNLAARENISLAFGFEPGTFAGYEKSLFQKIMEYWIVALIITSIIAVVTLIVLSVQYVRRSNRSNELHTYPAEYIPPKNSSVIISSSVLTPRGSVFSAQLIDLAVRHKIAIIETRKKSTWRAAEYDLKVVGDVADLRAEELEVLSDMFGKVPSINDVLSLKSLNNSTAYAKRTLDNEKKLKNLIEGEYALRAKNPADTNYFKRWAIAFLVIGLLTLSPLVLIFSGIIAIMAASLRPLTDKGLELRRYLLGLDKYIKAAEVERLKFLQGPDTAQKVGFAVNTDDAGQMVKLYERVLPYAILFGREKDWSKRLGDFYASAQTNPDWLTGNTAFNAVAFSSMVSSFSQSTAYSAGSSSSSGGSSGGGSSGGGGGGGGGGGW